MNWIPEKRLSAMLGLAGCLGLLLATSACTQQPSADNHAAEEAALRATDAQWSKTAALHDLDGTVAYYSDDAILLPPNAPIVADKAAIRALWAEMVAPTSSISWQVSKVEVARSGELGYVTGVYQLTMKGPSGQTISDRGKFLEVWKKQADGKWKAIVDTYNSDLPAPAPAAKKK